MILVRPTGRGKLMLMAFVVAVIIAFVNVNLTTCIIASIMGGMLVSSFILAFFSLYRIQMERLSSHDAVKGGKAYMPVTLTNKSRRSRQTVIISEECEFVENNVFNTVVESLKPRENRIVNRVAVPLARGLYQLDKIRLIGGDPAGFFAREKVFSFPDEIMIFPDYEKLNWMPIRIRRQIQSSVQGRPLGISGLGQDFFGVREYKHTDGIRYIHWKASAKYKQLMVKEFEAHAISQVCIVLDVDERSVEKSHVDNNFEFLIKTVASIAEYLSGMYCRILFITADGAKNEIVKFDGEAYGVKERIINLLAYLQPSVVDFNELLDSSIDMYRPNSILYCLTMSEPEDIDSRFDILVDKRVDVRWIYAPKVYFEDDHVFGFLKVELPDIELNNYAGISPYVAHGNVPISRMLSYG